MNLCKVCNEPNYGPHPHMCPDCVEQSTYLRQWWEMAPQRQMARRRFVVNSLAFLGLVVVMFFIEVLIFGPKEVWAVVTGGNQ